MLLNSNKLSSKKIINNLNEWISRSTVSDAINNRDVVTIYYDSALDTTINRGYRIIEPYCLGMSKAGNLVVRAWQQSGASDTPEDLAGWRMFRLDGIKTMYSTYKKFNTSSEFLKQNRPNYNPDDRDMTQILVAVQPDSGVINTPSIDDPKKNISVGSSQFDKQSQEFKKFYSKPQNSLNQSWFAKLKNKFMQDLRK